jgi:ApbE superfamily uncharacterized protein (UPF0280 family)
MEEKKTKGRKRRRENGGDSLVHIRKTVFFAVFLFDNKTKTIRGWKIKRTLLKT